MRARTFFALVLIAVLTLGGCSALSGLSGRLQDGGQADSAPSSAGADIGATLTEEQTPVSEATPSPVATPSPRATRTPRPSATPSPTRRASPTATAARPTAAASVADAIKAVIERANDQQQQAFAQDDPTLMRDTATIEYYYELVQINSDMADWGVTSIQLVKIEWGPITVTNTTAEAITYETWRTTLVDDSVYQSRDRNEYTLVLEKGEWRIQSDEHPDTDPTLPVEPPSPRATVPPGEPAELTDLSRNWSGYSATGGEFTAVSGTWIVPESGGATGVSGSAIWVGIGGADTRDLIQAGTVARSDGYGNVEYESWIETLPQPIQPIPLSVSPGDSVTVSISQKSSGRWSIEVSNNTTGALYETTVKYDSSLSSAEWVVEAPSTGRRLLPLDDFGTVHFTNGSTIKDGESMSIAESGAGPVAMSDSYGSVIASPSALTADGDGFSVSRLFPSTRPSRPRSFGTAY